jgi:hypothetical protein
MTESTRIFRRTSSQYVLLKSFSRKNNVYALGGLMEDNIRCFLKTCEWQCFISCRLRFSFDKVPEGKMR